jgi:hypothetical protein
VGELTPHPITRPFEMATTWNPLAVALVSSGSRGNKLLFYHSGVSQSQTLEKELLSKLPQRTLAEILAPSGVMIGKKFELRVDEWKFVGHPFTLQQPLMTASFNIVFILQSVCSTDVVKCYENLSHILGVAALHEEERRGIIAPNNDFTPSMTDARGYLPVEWWIMSKTVAMNPIPLENEGLTSLLIEGQAHTLQSLLEVAEKDLMGEYTEKWPLAKVLDIGGPSCVPRYVKYGSSLSPDSEVPPIPCHVHAGDVVNGACTGHGKTEAYFFPPTDVPPYNLTLGTIKTRLRSF